MSITITCEFENPYQARQAAERLRRRGYIVSGQHGAHQTANGAGTLLVAYPYGNTGGNSFGNNLMGGLPPIAGNGIIMNTPPHREKAVISVLTDDTQTSDAKILLEGLGGHIL